MSRQLIEEMTHGRDYKVCLNCARHPMYPDLPPLTLHRGLECMICHNLPQRGNMPVKNTRVHFGVSSMHHLEE